MTKRQRRTDARVRLLAMIAGGAGLILIGAALSVIAYGNNRAARGNTSASDGSVVPAAVNFPAPALSLPNTSGQMETLEQYRGRVVLVNNWAIWCPPCKAEMPTLQAYYEAHAEAGLTVIGIEAGEPADEVTQFAKSLGLTFPVWVDTETASLTAFRNSGLPNSYLIDRSGTVRLAWIGEISRPMLEKHVTPFLEE